MGSEEGAPWMRTFGGAKEEYRRTLILRQLVNNAYAVSFY